MQISDEQAHAVAVAIYKEIKPFIEAHQEEFQEWLKENGYTQEAGNGAA